jgi:hypothetical protein
MPASAAVTDPPFVELPLFPNVPAPVLVDLSFSPEGDTLWVLSGDLGPQQESGPQPTTVTALRLPRTDASARRSGLPGRAPWCCPTSPLRWRWAPGAAWR